MKHTIITLSLILLISSAYSQSLSYSQLQSVFNSWKTNKGDAVGTTTQQLKLISSKWHLRSTTPTVEGYNKYFVWEALESKIDTALLVLYVEEDETSFKFSLKYAFHNNPTFINLRTALFISPYYRGNVTSFGDQNNAEFTYTGKPLEVGPLSTRIDCILTDYDSQAGSKPRLFTFDLISRYINK